MQNAVTGALTALINHVGQKLPEPQMEAIGRRSPVNRRARQPYFAAV